MRIATQAKRAKQNWNSEELIENYFNQKLMSQ